MKQRVFKLILIFVFSWSAFAQAETCPQVDVIGGGVVEAGTAMSFTAQVTGKTNNPNLEYDWKISNGTITNGRGTASITIDTTGLAGNTNIKATVKIKGLPEGCSDTASEVGSTTMGGDPLLLDEFGKILRNEIKARVDNLLSSLTDKPELQSYIINYGTDKEIAAREKLIRDHIALRKNETARIRFVRGGANPADETGAWTKIWILPAGVTPSMEQ